jgi:hypothetical protein
MNRKLLERGASESFLCLSGSIQKRDILFDNLELIWNYETELQSNAGGNRLRSAQKGWHCMKTFLKYAAIAVHVIAIVNAINAMTKKL